MGTVLAITHIIIISGVHEKKLLAIRLDKNSVPRPKYTQTFEYLLSVTLRNLEATIQSKNAIRTAPMNPISAMTAGQKLSVRKDLRSGDNPQYSEKLYIRYSSE